MIFQGQNHDVVTNFEYPRWEENPKPGYQGNPSDHFPFDWNWRTLKSNRSRNTINFALKSIKDTNAYGFRGGSQLMPDWKDNNLSIPTGDYLVKIAVFGTGMREPATTWVGFKNPGKGNRINVYKTRKYVMSDEFSQLVRDNMGTPHG